jgi:hypothetical protein
LADFYEPVPHGHHFVIDPEVYLDLTLLA